MPKEVGKLKKKFAKRMSRLKLKVFFVSLKSSYFYIRYLNVTTNIVNNLCTYFITKHSL